MAFETYTDGTPTNGANPWIDSLVWGGQVGRFGWWYGHDILRNDVRNEF